MARRKAPEMTAEERDRLRRIAEERRSERVAASAIAVQDRAKAWLQQQGLIVPGEPVGKGLARLDQWRHAKGYGVGQAAVADYRPTLRQRQAAILPGIELEVEF